MNGKVSLKGIETLGAVERLKYSNQLVDARIANNQLERELPYVHQGYRGILPTYRRLGIIARTQSDHQLQASVILREGVAEGMASIQDHLPEPNALNLSNMIRRAVASEVSYWHRRRPDQMASINLGIQVMQQLIDKAEVDSLLPYREVWSVTLPDDELKRTVYEEVGMIAVGEPIKYSLEDGVDEPRQLWTRHPYSKSA